MVYELYSIYDKKAGMYSNPQVEINQDCALRRFEFIVKQSASQGIEATDCELYKIGTCDDVKGTIEALEKPLFVWGVSTGNNNQVILLLYITSRARRAREVTRLTHYCLSAKRDFISAISSAIDFAIDTKISIIFFIKFFVFSDNFLILTK